ncbi:DUF1036 domain-containing protein [Calothrix sp. PCC 7507]|jgi:uncharacterized membrane protein|uniref:DUF1036 domain-containing protein n=1 Tax=Calothrix sp. PCC 7507 TaxID=99598 RepID=UPI00029EFA5C|nr:DUF1036 domain-containing protein [Calothrix sp. PCC 7507]AFY32058.1 hypothetical protein Cal7507_1599 [Calothrix sp. PCC 7507]
MHLIVVLLPILSVLPFLFSTAETAIAIPYRSGGKCSSSGIDIDLVTGQTRSIFMPPDPSCYGSEAVPQRQPRPQGYQFHFSNNCSRPVQVAVIYLNLNNNWETRGWWRFAPGETANLSSNKEGIPIISHNKIFYFYAQTVDSSERLIWDGNTYMSLNGERLGFREMQQQQADNNNFSVQCK